MKNRLEKKQQGFTIIEVLIVLAIAGLIMVIVLVAVPQLQRSQRNQARQSVAGRVATEINNYAGNNNGTLPLASNDAAKGFTGGFKTRYLNGVNIKDPKTNDDVVITANSADADGPRATAFANDLAATQPGSVNYVVGRVCDAGELTKTASARNFALQIRLEGGAIYCLDNQ